MKKEYSNGNITVVWQHQMCIHSKNCFHGLAKVFNPAQRPWVNINAADDEQIIAQINKCPSGALSYYINATGKPLEIKSTMDNSKSIIAKKEPQKVALQEGKPYAWCACGRSEKQPFCDGTHKKTDLTPMVFKAEKSADAWLCQCKQTSNPPYCDGTHNTL